jgi:formate dehydrogenase major subunit
MSRWNTWLAELQPELFAEIDPELAREKGVANGDWVTVSTSRAQVEARALVTSRMQPLRVNGRVTHVVGMPYHWGPAGVVVGDVVNDLIGIALDPTVKIDEDKVFTCDLRKGRKNDPILQREFEDLQTNARNGGAVDRVHSEGAEMRQTSSAREQSSVAGAQEVR